MSLIDNMKLINQQILNNIGLTEPSLFYARLAWQLNNDNLAEQLIQELLNQKRYGYSFTEVVWATKIPDVGRDSAMEMGLDALTDT